MSGLSADDQTLDLIYSSVVEPSLWPRLVDRLTSVLGGEVGALTQLHIENGAGSAMFGDGGGDPSVLKTYFEYFFSINPLQIVPDSATYVQGWRPKVLLDEEWMPRDELERTEYYNDFLRPLSTERGLLIRLGLQGKQVAAINIGRADRRGRFDADEIAAATRLHPHLIRAYGLSQKFAALQNMNDDLLGTLERSSSAMFLLDGSAAIVHANAAGEALVSRGEALCTCEGRLSATDARAAQSLLGLILEAATPDWERRKAGVLRITAPGQSAPYTVSATPLRLQQHSVFTHGSTILVQVTEPAAGTELNESSLAEMFGLTKAESRLTLALYAGATLREAASRYEISINTARVQLSSVMSKTGTHRQIDLVRLLTGKEAVLQPEPIAR